MNERSTGRGLAAALGAHAIWGAMPVYLILVKAVPAIEYVAWRTFFTLPLCLVILAIRKRLPELRRVLGNRRTVLTLTASAGLVATNWLIYVWSIQQEKVYAASLGYYLLPLVMLVLGMVVLKERLNRLQWAAAALALAGVAALSAGAITTLWISLTLALSFGLYGLLRKTVDAGPMVGLTVETLVLLPLVIAYLAWAELAGGGVALGRELVESLAIVAGGLFTAIPLTLFAFAARSLPYTIVGFVQFTSPTIVFLLGLLVFGEELRPAQLACFVAIWAAVALFSWDLWRRSGRPVEA